MKKRAVFYLRVSTLDQHPETQLHDLEQLAGQRGLEVVGAYEDKISGTRASRPGLDRLMADARQGKFEVLLVWACDRLARSVTHFLQVLDELGHLQIEFISFREQIDTGGPLGRAILVIVGAIAELERSLIVERVRAGLRRAKLEGRRIGRPKLLLDREAILRDRTQGLSLNELAAVHHVSKASICKVLKEAYPAGGHKTPLQSPPQAVESTRPESGVSPV
jgi:DNA invertase Pin-like site-specific DNA recombinase